MSANSSLNIARLSVNGLWQRDTNESELVYVNPAATVSHIDGTGNLTVNGSLTTVDGTNTNDNISGTINAT